MYATYDRLLSFASVHHMLRAEKILAAAGITIADMPTPREVDVSCGQCLLFHAGDEEKVMTLLADSQIIWSKLFCRNGPAKKYKKLAEWGG